MNSRRALIGWMQLRRAGEVPGAVDVPKRIRRGPTDLLQALADTVGEDYTAAQYMFHDDPYLMPLSAAAKKSYALGKDAGASAARHFAKEFPTLFMFDNDEPRIAAFRPSKLPESENGATEADLVDRMRKLHVNAAVAVYRNALSRGSELSQRCLHDLLEMLCYYNETQPDLDRSTAVRWFLDELQTQRSSYTWKDNGLAEQLFQSLEPKTARAYSAVICGMLKYNAHSKAKQLYDEMTQLRLIPDRRVYNEMLANVCKFMSRYEDRWDYIINLLEAMRDAGVQPDHHTFNSALESVREMRLWRDAQSKALLLYREMLSIGLPPTLGTYACLLDIFHKSPALESLIKQIVDALVNKDVAVHGGLMDSLFFPRLMQRCCDAALDVQMADRIHSILEHGRNKDCLTNFHAETVYYENYLLVCLRNGDSLEQFFRYYDRFVPRCYSPSFRFFMELIDTVGTVGGSHWLPRIWSEVIFHGYSINSALLRKLFTVISETVDPPPDVAAIGRDAYRRILGVYGRTDRDARLPAAFSLTADLLSRIAVAVAKGDDDKESAWQIVDILAPDFDRDQTAEELAIRRMRDTVDGRPAADIVERLLVSLASNQRLRQCQRLYKLLLSLVSDERQAVADRLLSHKDKISDDQYRALRALVTDA